MSSTLFIAVQCCQCSTMQVKQQKKSSNKWTCVVCHQKQSVLKVFAQSYMAKDILQFVQSRNMARKFADEQAVSLEPELTEEEPVTMLPASASGVGLESKRRTDWSEYLDPAEEYDSEQETVEEGGIEVITEMPPPKRSRQSGGAENIGDGLLNQMRDSKKVQAKESQGGPRKYEPSMSKLAEANRRNDDSDLVFNKKETMACELPRTTTAKSSKWDDYITNDEDEW